MGCDLSPYIIRPRIGIEAVCKLDFFFSNVYLFIHHTCMRDLVIISTAKQCRLCANKTLKKNTGLYTTQRVCKYTTVMYTRKELYCMITCIYTYRKIYVRGTRLYTRVCLYSFQG